MTAGRALRMAYLVAALGGVGFFVMSVTLLGEWPRRVLDAQTRAMAPEHPLPMTASERRGRAVYSREGCAYCHSQQVRYLHADMARFGAPTLAWETRLDYPHLWGTRRIGPDLSREGGARPGDWQLAHLFAPRAMVATSIMPAYTWLFDGAADRPRQEARDLVAYLDSLGRARALAGPEGNQRAREACQCPDDEMAQMAFEGPLDAHPARTRRSREAPAMPASGDIARGEQLYAGHCASCHGTKGDGTGPGASMLSPRPGNLAEHEYSEARLAAILWNGVYGSAMPAWRDRPLDELAALIAVVRRLGSSEPERQVPESLVELGARVYAANCSQCHGEKGEGNGSAVPQLTMDPTDFHQQRPSLAESLRVLRGGIAGTPMVPWTTRLSDAELVAVANFVRGFYEGERPR